MTILPSSTLSFFSDFVTNDEGKQEVIVGRTGINRFIEIPRVGLDVIEKFKEGKSLNRVEQEMGEDAELSEFIYSLIDLNFIDSVDGYEISSEAYVRPKGITFERISQRVARLFFNSFSAIILFLFVISAIVLQVKSGQSLIPTYEEFFWHKLSLVVVVTCFFFDILTGFLHEMGHFMAIRGLGNNLGYMSIGRRLIHLVYTTKIDSIWALTKKQRLNVYLAGIYFDLFLIAGFIYLGYFFPVIAPFCRFAQLYLIFGIIFEFKFYMKTDVSYVVSELLNRPNLHDDSMGQVMSFLKGKSWRLNPYAIFIIIGSALDIWVTLKYLIPSIKKLALGAMAIQGNGDILSGMSDLFSLLVIAFQLLLVLYLFLKERKNG